MSALLNLIIMSIWSKLGDFVSDVWDYSTGWIGDVVSGDAVKAYTGQQANETNQQNVESTNQTNLQIARETNEQNRQLYERGIQNQWDMWNANNAYNSPAAQRQRLQAAGVNPALGLLNGANTGTAEATSAPSAPQMQGATMQAAQINPLNMTPIVNAMLGSIGAFADADLKHAQTQGLKMDNAYKNEDWSLTLADKQAEIRRKMSEVNKNSWTYKSLKQQYELNELTMKDLINSRRFDWIESAQRVAESKERMRNMVVERSWTETQTDLAKMNYRLDSAKTKAFCDEVYQKIDNLKSEKNLTDQQAKTEVQRTVTEVLKQSGMRISNKNAQRLTDSMIKNYEAQTAKIRGDNEDIQFGPFKFSNPRRLENWSHQYNDRRLGYSDYAPQHGATSGW